jgi:hypothetical protein
MECQEPNCHEPGLYVWNNLSYCDEHLKQHSKEPIRIPKPSEDKPAFYDIAERDEDDRIKTIGELTLKLPKGRTACFMTEMDVEGKTDRYVRKLQERFPGIRIISRHDNIPAQNIRMVKLGPPE